ncbi:malonyl-CoA-acyl carrier protein transacylase, mitochondrial-like [Diadema antillarum]|uniref:malonyl-CoA-acyl carrier protein transacylase, mitochondrial-like n=1 Tax=Diadema antillarum TaxID=105358 RepID=UPI003A877CB7
MSKVADWLLQSRHTLAWRFLQRCRNVGFIGHGSFPTSTSQWGCANRRDISCSSFAPFPCSNTRRRNHLLLLRGLAKCEFGCQQRLARTYCTTSAKRAKSGIPLRLSAEGICGRRGANFEQPSCRLSTSLKQNSNTKGDDVSQDLSQSGNDRENSRELSARDRRAGIKALLDDAKADDTSSEEFDFGDDKGRTDTERGRQQQQRPMQDPSETSVLLFPGQGSQFVGMGRGLLKYPNVEEMFAAASEILGYDLLALCINGPAEELDRTIHCQPAVVVTALAAVEKLKEEMPKAIENCVAAAGFSVGEFAALVFAGSISFEDAIYLIKVRAEAMQHASEAVSSGMISVVGGRRARYKFVCKEAENYCRNHHGVKGPVCRVANYLYPDARVLAGHSEALSFIKEMSKSFDLKMVRPIPVSGAFHTPLMSSAQEPLAKALASVAVETPVISVHSNVDGNTYGSPKHIRRQLKRQVAEPVMWEQTMHNIYQRPKNMAFPFTYEIGPGKQLGSILKRNNLKASQSLASVEV